jgi:hypothetical protein
MTDITPKDLDLLSLDIMSSPEIGNHGSQVKLHSKRVGKIQNYTPNECGRFEFTLGTSVEVSGASWSSEQVQLAGL